MNIKLFITFLLLSISTIAQVKIGDNITVIGASSLFELENTNKTLVVTRPTNAAAIGTAVNGMIIYDSAEKCFKGYADGAWKDFTTCTTSLMPVSSSMFFTTSPGESVTSTLQGIDNSGQALTYTIVKQPLRGTLTVNQLTGTFTYIPISLNEDQRISFSYFVTNASGYNSQESVVSIFTTNQEQKTIPTVFNDGGVLNHKLQSSDSFSSSFSYTIEEQPSMGTIILSSSGDFSYTANTGIASGFDYFKYKVVFNNGEKEAIITSKIEINSLHLQLPDRFHFHVGFNALSGLDNKIYLDNIIRVANISDYTFSFTVNGTSIGVIDNINHIWTYNPTTAGVQKMLVEVFNSSSILQARGFVELVNYTLPTTIQPGKFLGIGDSLTNGGQYLARMKSYLTANYNNAIEFVETSFNSGTYNEGWGGNTWERFISTGGSNHFRRPFYFSDTNSIDFQRYINERIAGKSPDYTTILLGVNDMYSITTSPITNYETIKTNASSTFAKAEVLFVAIKNALPYVKILVATLPPPNISQAAFNANYANPLQQEYYRTMQQVYVGLQKKYFGNREKENIFLITTFHSLDTTSGYPINNALHPNAFGYNQIGDTFWQEVLYRMN